MTKYLLTIAVVSIIAFVALRLLFRKPAISPKKSEEAQKFAQQLDELGYFRYAAPNDVAALKIEMAQSFYPDGDLPQLWDSEMNTRDFRNYFCDNENLAEGDGFEDMLNVIKPTLDKLGAVIKITAPDEFDLGKDGTNRTIGINNKEYVIFKNQKDGGWAEAVQRFVEIVNGELQKQHINERLYPANGGNEGSLVFLTDEQFAYINSVLTNKRYKPLRVKDWCMMNEIGK